MILRNKKKRDISPLFSVFIFLPRSLLRDLMYKKRAYKLGALKDFINLKYANSHKSRASN